MAIAASRGVSGSFPRLDHFLLPDHGIVQYLLGLVVWLTAVEMAIVAPMMLILQGWPLWVAVVA